MKLTRRQAILGALAVPLASKAVPGDGVALTAATHPHDSAWFLEDGADIPMISVEAVEVDIVSEFDTHIQAILAKSYRETAAIIYGNTMNYGTGVMKVFNKVDDVH